MSEFIYLYRGGRRAESPAEGEQIIQKWTAWLQDLTSKGHIKDRGQPLELEGRVVRGKQRAVSDGPYPDSGQNVSGYTVVEANDLAQATELAAGCPIFDRDGAVEVRPVMHM
jgi:hypothetical protein